MGEIKESLVKGDSNNNKLIIENHTEVKLSKNEDKPYKRKILWWSVLVFSLMHAGAVYGLFLPKQWKTIGFVLLQYFIGGFGVTAGVHRFFTHRTYKANTKLRLLLIYMQTTSFQFSVFTWSLKHRIHHKFTDTNSDPHNSTRGFFFSHMGWLMVERHPDVKRISKQIDMSDLSADSIVMFQHNHYFKLMILSSIIIPIIITYFWLQESLAVSFFFSFLTRHVILLHCTCLINSFAHVWGTKPFNSKISATESKFNSAFTLGEGFHNYHHSFPWDYKTAELPLYTFNLSTAFIDFFHWLGWATDLKTASSQVIESRKLKTFDETQ